MATQPVPSIARRYGRWLIALALLPLCLGCSWAMLDVLLKSRGAVDFWLTLLGGGACWVVVFLLLPKPMWIYVAGHELTHALCAWLSGGKVKSLKVTAEGGQVVLSKTNVLIALAPYFLPLYSL
ncbi:MAG TPA: M50 family metallopeptidase, partial [Candidatus Limnocylindria bacterium]|nr:M50 family metallopeptidase [Candidatus Limnocylindria bacterium]